MDEVDLPLLDEVPPLELANTAYGEGDDAVDFLGEPGAAAVWLALVGPSPWSRALSDAELVDLVELRNAVRGVLEARLDGVRPTRAALDVLDRHAGGAPVVTRLVWDDRPAVTVLPGTPDLRGVLGWIAVGAIELVAGPDGDALARCEAPDCTMLFVRRHGRRRFCHESCSHRMRQARYERRRSAGRRG